jgi:hypothetical protein
MYFAILPVGREADFRVGEEERDIRTAELDRLGVMYTVKGYCNVVFANRDVCEHNTKLHSANCKWERHLTDESESGSDSANQPNQDNEDSKPPAQVKGGSTKAFMEVAVDSPPTEVTLEGSIPGSDSIHGVEIDPFADFDATANSLVQASAGMADPFEDMLGEEEEKKKKKTPSLQLRLTLRMPSCQVPSPR